MPNFTGTVQTSTGKGLVNIPVLLVNDKSLARVTSTDKDGIYIFVDVPVGEYVLSTVQGQSLTNLEGEIKKDQTGDSVVNFTLNSLISRSPFLNFLINNSYIPLKYFQYIFLASIGLYFFCALIVHGLPELNLASLADKESMRGTITYLIAVTTISMAALLMLASIMIGGQEVKERLALGKEILTLLIGILGTIIGFYYGSADKNTPPKTNPSENQNIKTLTINSINSSQKATNLTTIAKLIGGTPPYSYTIAGSPATIFGAKVSTTKDENIKESFSVVDSVKVDKITIIVKDAKGDTTSKSALVSKQ